MNHIYNVKFNKKTGKYQAVGEHVTLNGKGSRGAKALIAAKRAAARAAAAQQTDDEEARDAR